MFRNKETTEEQFLKKFHELKEKLDEQPEIRLDSEYHEKIKAYIDQLAKECQEPFELDDIREINMTHLNRLQRLKNNTSYKKDKHKHKERNQDWG